MNEELYGLTKLDAFQAYQDGLPSLLPDKNPWKGLVEDHRWGKHHDYCPARCPVNIAPEYSQNALALAEHRGLKQGWDEGYAAAQDEWTGPAQNPYRGPNA